MLSYNGDLISSTSAYAHGLSLLSNSVPSGVLQERSINRSYDYTRHQPSPTYDNNEYKHEPVHRTDAQYFIQELYRINRSCTRLLPDAELDRQARMLYDHFLTFERYENYRKSHDKHTSDDSLKLTSKDGKEAGEMRWPDHMELAFFKALVVLPPQGRKSWKYPLIFMDHPPDDKEKHPQKGRNELIADLIRRWTGDRVVKRKHISSHIQVLKAYVVEDQITVAKFFGESKKKMERMTAAGRERSRYQHRHSGMTTSGRSHMQLRLPQLDSPIILGSKMHDGAGRQYFKVKKFEMYVKDGQNRVVHSFTRFNSMQPRTTDVPFSSLDQSLPALSSVFNDNTKTSGPDCNLILAHATLAMTASSLGGTELSIEYSIRTEYNLMIYDKFECRTRFFINGDNPCIKHISDGNNVTKEINYNHLEATLTAIPFGSGFWASSALGNVGNKLREATRATHRSKTTGDANEAMVLGLTVQRLYSDVKASIVGLSAVQEIFASARGRLRTRILVICWTFQQAENGEEGTTTWQHVTPPHTSGMTDIPQQQQQHHHHQPLLSSVSNSFVMTHSDPPSHPLHQMMQHHPVSDLSSTFPSTTSYSHPTYFPDSQPQSYSNWQPASTHADYQFNLCLDTHRAQAPLFDNHSSSVTSTSVHGPSVTHNIFEPNDWHSGNFHPQHQSIAQTYYASAGAQGSMAAVTRVGHVINIGESFDTIADVVDTVESLDPSGLSEESTEEVYAMVDAGHVLVEDHSVTPVGSELHLEAAFDDTQDDLHALYAGYDYGLGEQTKQLVNPDLKKQHSHIHTPQEDFDVHVQPQRSIENIYSQVHSPEQTQQGATETFARDMGLSMKRGFDRPIGIEATRA